MTAPVILFPDDPFPALPVGHLRALLAAARRVDTPQAKAYAEHAESLLTQLGPRGPRRAATRAESSSNGDVQKLADPAELQD